MAKGKKNTSPEIKGNSQELYTIIPNDAFEKPTTPPPSSSNVYIEKTIQTPIEKPLEANGEIIQITDVPVDTANKVVVEKVIKKEIKHVYEIKYVINKQEYVFYTHDTPELINNTIVLIKPFGRKDLREVVLGKKEIKAFCKVDLNEEAIKVDLLKGALIRMVEERPWMSLPQDETQRLFDQEVLQAYRQLSTTIKSPTNINKPTSNADIDSELYPIGNIPVKRPRIQDL